jgi:hypothetical protein
MLEQHPLHCIPECVDALLVVEHILSRRAGDRRKQADKVLRVRERDRHRVERQEQAPAVPVGAGTENGPQLRAAAEKPAVEKLGREHRVAPQMVQAGFEDLDLF